MGNLDLLVICLDFIESHLCEDMKTIDIANACHVSKSTLEKVFQYVNHISVHGYVIRRRMMLAARRIAEHPEDMIFRIGGDEFCILTASDSKENAGEIIEKIRQRNGEPFSFEGQEIPLYLHLAVAKIKEDHPGHSIKYDELFSKLHTAIHDAKR